MKISSKALGEIEVAEQQCFEMPAGMIGFPRLRRYALVPFPDSDVPFFWWQSLEDASLCFVLIDPGLVFSDYQVSVSAEELAEIELSEPASATVLAVVTIPENPRDMTVNLMGPLVINRAAGKAAQLVLTDSRFTTKHRILPAEASDHACAHSQSE
ncbi:MAG: flagellar assembly protein FliW [Candidatus Abyssobacteria bacterium SURF_5]|uniref:Flagellar assembly factor FliW n=1 Tax=Abyssobacteria bacterium (strain SURF_5) TaxID=2093360 RepID=A0A3A4P0C9_ABYX5|nr:MAG: flagellar assembly protein FliW [Candidatus Abyssubacteria bacterium SURF_5]